MFDHLQEPLNVSWHYIVGSSGEKLSFPPNTAPVYPVVEPPKPVRRTYDICPGCHSNDVQTGSDGFGDFWYHCRNCGEEGFCDYGSEEYVLRGNKPPTKQPPYFDEHPLPAQYGVGTPSQIRARATKP